MIAASSASAFERQHHFGLDGGVGMLKVGGKDSLSVGGGGGLHYTYGMTDAFDLMVEGCFMQVALEELPAKGIQSNRPTSFSNAGVGVLRWIPYGGVLLEGYSANGGTVQGPSIAVGGAIALGLDYAFNRTFAMGIAFRQHFPFSKISDYPTYSQLLLRVEIAWGY
jgi:hypothetical protein